jgi:phospholipid/cholesterol/gamma-HCH transport system substrate-binding protein
VRELTAATQAGKQPGELSETVDNLRTASKSLDSALSHVDVVAGRVDRGEGTIGRLSKDETLINEVQGVAEGVNDYVGGIAPADDRRAAHRLQLPREHDQDYVSLRLQPREDKYYEIELINDPRGLTSYPAAKRLTRRTPCRPCYQTTTDDDRLAPLLVQFARRLGPFTGRFGIKESTGGV